MILVLRQIPKRYFYFLIIFILILAIVIFGFFFNKKTSFVNKKDEIKTEAKILADRVGQHMFLPQDEVPTIATVSDPESLADQTFFEYAKKGDKVLIYSNAKKAILYDPSADKIITIAPLNIEGTDLSNDFKKEKKIENNNQF